MHDFLHISNVSRLPSSVQPSVLAAANGSFLDLEKVCATVSSPDLREFPEDTTILLCFLPVLYIHLDPARIPTAEEVDHGLSVTTAIPAVAAASLALKATCEIAELPIFPDEIGLDLWLRVWPWMQFMDTYWELLRTFDPKEKTQVALRNWALVQTLRGCGEETRAVIAAQYGLRFMAARDWTAVLLDGSVVEDRDVLEHASRIINTIAQDLKVPEHFQEVVDGADGDLDRLASAMIRHTSLIVACPNKDLRFRASLLIPSPLVGSHKQEKFVSLLLSRGIVRNLVLITRILDGPKDGVHPLTAKEADSGPKENSLFTLVKYFRVAPGYPWIAEAIRAGFLSMIISFALQNIDFRMQMNLQTILRTILPLNLVSPSVITEMRRALVGVEEYSCKPEFRHSPLFADWEVLVDFANERYRILDKWEATRGSSLKACDNVKCGKIELKNKFKRCAGCLSANYCSVDCQSDDWQDGHRMVCGDLRAVRSREFSFGF
ncbi:hypothetical protein C8R46DRAFT_1095122 [Mycena filopes]|nr:hypothetical protein C8R46DRAFT_1095122 [Mycena filopes]